MVFADEKQCGQVQFQEGKQKYMFNCGNHSASEVTVKLSNGQSLQICELEVLGEINLMALLVRSSRIFISR
jgi:hypothetical protein